MRALPKHPLPSATMCALLFLALVGAAGEFHALTQVLLFLLLETRHPTDTDAVFFYLYSNVPWLPIAALHLYFLVSLQALSLLPSLLLFTMVSQCLEMKHMRRFNEMNHKNSGLCQTVWG